MQARTQRAPLYAHRSISCGQTDRCTAPQARSTDTELTSTRLADCGPLFRPSFTRPSSLHAPFESPSECEAAPSPPRQTHHCCQKPLLSDQQARGPFSLWSWCLAVPVLCQHRCTGRSSPAAQAPEAPGLFSVVLQSPCCCCGRRARAAVPFSGRNLGHRPLTDGGQLRSAFLHRRPRQVSLEIAAHRAGFWARLDVLPWPLSGRVLQNVTHRRNGWSIPAPGLSQRVHLRIRIQPRSRCLGGAPATTAAAARPPPPPPPDLAAPR